MAISKSFRFIFFMIFPFLLLFFLFMTPISAQQPTIISSFDSPGDGAAGLTWDGQYLWHADKSNDKIYKLTTSGQIIDSFSSPGDIPAGLTWDGQYLWHAGDSDDKIYKLTTDGQIVDSFSTPGDSPAGLAYDGQYLWYADSVAQKIYKLTTTGRIVSSFNSPSTWPWGLSWDGQYLWVTDYYSGYDYKIHSVDPINGQVINSFDAPGDFPAGLAWDGQYLWHADLYYDKIYKLDVYGVGDGGGGDGVTTDSPPVVSITNPTENSMVRGIVTISADVSDDIGVSKVEFYVDNSLLNTFTSSPYSFEWDTSSVENGAHSVSVKAYDTSNQSTEEEIGVIVNNIAEVSIASLDVPSEVMTGKKFTVTAVISNAGSTHAKNVTATLNLPESMIITSGSSKQDVGTVYAGGETNVTWTVQAKSVGEKAEGVIVSPLEKTEIINVNMSSSNAGSDSKSSTVLVKPSVTYQIIHTRVLGLPLLGFLGVLSFIPLLAFFGVRFALSRRDEYIAPIRLPKELPEKIQKDLEVEIPETISCLSCTATIRFDVEKCPECGEKVEKCPVCMVPLQFGDDFAKCPHCKTFAHRDHLLEWIKIKGKCPMCRKPLTDIDIPS